MPEEPQTPETTPEAAATEAVVEELQTEAQAEAAKQPAGPIPEGEPEQKAEPEPAPEPAPTAADEDLEIEIDDAVVPLSDLVATYKAYAETQELKKDAEGKIEAANRLVDALRDHPVDTLLRVFSQVYGSQQRAYHHIVNLAEKVVAKHLEFEGMPEEQRENLRQTYETRSKQDELTRREAELARKEAEAEELRVVDQITEEVRGALKGAKLEATSKTMANIFEIMHRAAEIGVELSAEKAVVRYQRALAQQREEALRTADPTAFPDEVRRKVAAANVEAVKAGRVPAKSAKTPARAESKSEYKVVSSGDWDDYIAGKL